MCARSDQPDSRDQAIARLLAETLKQGPSPGSACPDAELVAAYADRGLSNSERELLESHFAQCERCQQVLAVLGAAMDAPVGASVAVMPVPAAAPATPRPAPSPQRWLWWLSPAFGAAAAVMLWMVLRPAAPEPVQTAANYPAVAGQESRAINAPATPEAPAAKTRRDEQLLDRLSRVESGPKENAAETRAQAFGQLAAPPADSASATAPFPAGRSEVTSVAPQQAPAVQAMAPAPPAQDQATAANEQAPLQARTTALGGTLSAQSAAGPAAGGRLAEQDGLYAFVSPAGGALWRVGAAGLIEKSPDNGQTWQQQASGVTADLVAGSAASNEVAWVVGRATVILRTIDGQQWQRIAPPAGVTGDWVTVVVRSATSATVVGPMRRFSTDDGGMTWTEQK